MRQIRVHGRGGQGVVTAAEMLADGSWTWEDVDAAGATVREETGNAGFVIRDFDYLNWDYLSTVWNGWGAAPKSSVRRRRAPRHRR